MRRVLPPPEQRRGRGRGAARGRGGPGRGPGHRRAPRQRYSDDLLGAGRRAGTGRCTSTPGAGWFPHYLGYAGERGAGPGAGFTRNLPLAPGTGDDGWLAALGVLCAEASAFALEAVVVSLGLDAAAADPESPLQVTEAGYRAAGQQLAALGPTVLVQEGGYDLASLGAYAVATLEGAASPRPIS